MCMEFSNRHCILKQLKKTYIARPASGVPFSEFRKSLSIKDLNSKTGLSVEIVENVIQLLQFKGYVSSAFLQEKAEPHFLLTEKGHAALASNKFIWINIRIFIIGPLLLLALGLISLYFLKNYKSFIYPTETTSRI